MVVFSCQMQTFQFSTKKYVAQLLVHNFSTRNVRLYECLSKIFFVFEWVMAACILVVTTLLCLKITTLVVTLL